MAYFNTTTPQLRFIERVFEAYRTRDLNNLALLYSRDFSYRWLPKAAEFPDETREGHIESLGPLFAKLAKVDVRIQHRGPAFELNTPLLAHHSRSD